MSTSTPPALASDITITHCTVLDGPGLARNNMSAFWSDPNWVLCWPHTTLALLIPECAKRLPRNLLNSRITTRHQKAVSATGEIVGYARWILPAGVRGVADGGKEEEGTGMWGVWREAIVPRVGGEEEGEIRRVAEAAKWAPGSATDALDPPVQEIKNEILRRKGWMQLDYLAVHPDHSRQGIATKLVESGMRAAQEMGCDIHILAFRMGVGVYRKLGFVVERELVQDDSIYGGPGEWGVWFMTYEWEKQGKKVLAEEKIEDKKLEE